MTGPGVASAIVERLLPATPEEVFDEWIDPEALLEWMCPWPARCLKAEVEPWVGGRLRIDIEDAGRRFWVSGTYTDLDRPARLGFTWSCSAWPDPALSSQVLVTLVPRGAGQTLLTITHSALTPDLTGEHLPGWRLIAEQLVREAFLAYDRGDVARMMDFVDPDLKWTCLDRGRADRRPRVCRGRGELEKAVRRQADLGLRAELEEVVAAGDQVMLVMRTPGLDGYRRRQAGDRTYDVVTVRDGLIVELRACRDRAEARSLAGIG